jgi:hypothetical protein
MSEQRPPDWHGLSYADEKLEGVLRDLDRVAPDDLRDPSAPLVDDATLPDRILRLDSLPIGPPMGPHDLPDEASRLALDKYREWVRTLDRLQDSAARLAAAKQAERWLRDVAARVRAACKSHDEGR